MPGPVLLAPASVSPAVRDAMILWDVATGATLLAAPGGAALPPGLDLPGALRAVGTLLGLAEAPAGADSVMAPGSRHTALRDADIAAARALWGTPAEEQAAGLLWRWDPALDALRADATAPEGRRIAGTSGRDAVFAGPGDDALAGGAGDDLLSPGAGFDWLDGGAGRDTVLIPWLRAEAPVDFRWNRISGPGGDDLFTAVEVLDLRDGDWVMDAAHPASRADALYRAFLGRAADGAGLSAAADALAAGRMTEGELALSLLRSAEHRDRFGAPTPEALARAAAAGPDTVPSSGAPLWVPDAEAALVWRLFDRVLDRDPSRGELLAWTDALEAAPAAEGVERFLAWAGTDGDAAALLAELSTLDALRGAEAATAQGVRTTPSTATYDIM